jgi:hypothetical protein
MSGKDDSVKRGCYRKRRVRAEAGGSSLFPPCVAAALSLPPLLSLARLTLPQAKKEDQRRLREFVENANRIDPRVCKKREEDRLER